MNLNEKQFEKDKVTVVMNVYNEERFLREALDSVVNQVDYVIIGDNASTDGTETIGREYMEKYPHVCYLRHEKNLGSIRNSNLCCEKVKTEYLFHLGGHDLLPPGYVAELKTMLETDPEAICAFPDVLNFDSFGNENMWPLPRKGYYSTYLKNPDPYFRAWRSLRNGFTVVPTLGLFRSEMLLPILKNYTPFVWCDVALTTELALHGTFLHSPKAIYRRRDVHIQKTHDEYYDDPMKRSFGESDMTMGGNFSDLRPFTKQVLLTYREFNNSKYLKSKAKYDFPLTMLMCKWSGEKMGYFFYDFWNQLNYRWRKSFFRAKWKMFWVYFKRNCIPYMLQKKKWRQKLFD